MEFVFSDKSQVDMEIITDLLYEEKIPYKIKRFVKQDYFFDDEEDEDFVIVEELYNIHCFTDLDHFDFIKHIAYKKIENRINLEKCYLTNLKVRKKNVRRVSKKNTTNTDSKDRGEQ